MTLQLPANRSDRRSFLKRLGATGAVTILGTSGLRPMTAWALPGDGNDPVVVTVFLRGGADGLHLVPPWADDNYYNLRPSLGVRADQYVDLDGFFGLHNSLAPLRQHFDNEEFAIVHAAGSNDLTRSHFVAQPNMDSAFDDTGWLQRALQVGQFDQASSGLTVGDRTSPPLIGPWSGTVVNTIDQTTRSGMSLAIARTAIEEMYATTRFRLDNAAVTSALLSVDQISAVTPGDPSAYPSRGLGVDFREAAAIIRADIGVRGVAIDYGGWDTHRDQVTRVDNLGSTLAEALTAFQADLGPIAERVVTVIMTEFGREVRQNGSGGTDHGHGNMMMVMGAPLQGRGGGRVHVTGQWPGLAPGADLFDDQDLAITTDFRSVLAELIDRHLGVDPTTVFAGFQPDYVGLLQANGDTNRSGTSDKNDAQSILEDLTGDTPTEYFARAGDIDGDGDTDLRDALLLAQQAEAEG